MTYDIHFGNQKNNNRDFSGEDDDNSKEGDEVVEVCDDDHLEGYFRDLSLFCVLLGFRCLSV